MGHVIAVSGKGGVGIALRKKSDMSKLSAR